MYTEGWHSMPSAGVGVAGALNNNNKLSCVPCTVVGFF